ncbi:hypothetical protein BJY24_002664 [Nocardia transvalensis]|uniref:DUF4185 domain-containing protein n=1 Tax=Nocardia transvalensis TaxID=37333 RepID=A0A7W9PCV9_9NOCA|nr:DUF4185 domain-containing protein [Nocardia transvalensis]MBB5913797.1 hypothetical protein [Nocardia transvalensis]
MGKGTAPALFGVLLAAVGLAAPAAAAPAPWAPPPVNSCGETGFDPRAREPDPKAPPPPLLPPLPPNIDIPVPYPEFVPVPVPGPQPDNTRIDPGPLPVDPCQNPCPDVRDTPKPAPPAEEPAPPADSGSGSGSADFGSSGSASSGSSSGSDSGSSQGSSSGSARFNIPRIHIRPEPEPIPIPVPGGEPPAPQTPPPPVVHPAEPGAVAAPVAPRQVESVDLVNQVTGHGSTNRTDMRWGVDGTDLGIMWENRPGEVSVLFGDTFGKGWVGNGAGGPDWRSNVIGYSTERDLSKGLIIDQMVQDSRCHAAELLDSRKIKNYETTVIPTSGFALGNRQYVSYMSVNHWDRIPGMWWTNKGGLAYSDDNGRTWVKDQYAVWDNMFGLKQFQVTTMVPHGDYVYMFGTPNGRIGLIGLARVPRAEVLNKSAYQYWVNGTWAPAEDNSASPILPGIAGELSVRFDEESGQWQLVYLDPARAAIVLRTAAEPQGAWTDGVELASTNDYPKAYGGFIHPWSTGRDLYFTMSAWDSYNVYLMHAKLDEPQPRKPETEDDPAEPAP